MPKTLPRGFEFMPESGPFSLQDDHAYDRWRARKLRLYPERLERQWVSIGRLDRPDAAGDRAIVAACGRANFALYRTDPGVPPTMEAVRAWGERLGLVHFDRHLWAPSEGIVALQRTTGSGRGDYIPYTDRPLKWHTDGYYNTADHAVRGVIMHCVNPAAEGGANSLLDPEMVYISIRDADPAYVEALMQPDAMTIPANDLEPGDRRPAVSGPVFSVNSADGSLHMRYTARTRSICWKDDVVTGDAVAFLQEILTPPVASAFQVRLKAGEGIVCNNVLHNRDAFTDGADTDSRRLLWRARYRERVAGNTTLSAAT